METMIPLEKVKISTRKKIITSSNGCCGGTPTSNADACCKLDEEKKSQGEEGCGCNSSPEKSKTKSSCC